LSSAFVVFTAAITCSSRRFCRRCSVIIVVRLSFKTVLSVFSSFDIDGLLAVVAVIVEILVTTGGLFGCIGTGTGTGLVLLVNSMERFVSLKAE